MADAGTWEVLAVRYGTLRSRKSEIYYRYDAYGEPDADIELAYYVWVLRGAGGATIVVDTGFDPAVGARRGRTCVLAPLEALARVGVEPASVSEVILTHLHYDHTGNVAAFPGATLHVPRRELEFWTGPGAAHRQFAMHAEADEVAVVAAAHAAGRARLIEGTAELFDGVTARCVGGHSPGQLVLVVATGSGDVVLTSDAVHFYEELELDRPFGVIADLEAMYAGFELVRALATEPGAALVPGHDPAVLARFPAVEGPGADCAVRVGVAA